MRETTDVSRVEEQGGLPATGDAKSILAVAVEKGIDPASIQKLVELVWKQEERTAAREFADALRAFQERCPAIVKKKRADISTRGGGAYSYRYAPLDQIAATVDPLLHELGLAYSWDSRTDGEQMTVTCTLRHLSGHRETASFTCPTTSRNPGMSDAQKSASAMTFARRQTLTAILGITTADEDVDGGDDTPITEEQAAQIRDLISAYDVNEAKFLVYMKAERVEDIRAEDFGLAVNALKAKGEK